MVAQLLSNCNGQFLSKTQVLGQIISAAQAAKGGFGVATPTSIWPGDKWAKSEIWYTGRYLLWKTGTFCFLCVPSSVQPSVLHVLLTFPETVLLFLLIPTTPEKMKLPIKTDDFWKKFSDFRVASAFGLFPLLLLNTGDFLKCQIKRKKTANLFQDLLFYMPLR